MASDADGTTAQPAQSSLSFTQGLLLGQLSVVLLIGAFIKFFIFGEAPPHSSRPVHRSTTRARSLSVNISALDPKQPSRQKYRSLRHKPSTNKILRTVPSSATNTPSILRKTYYNSSPTQNFKHGRRPQHSSHQPESLDWFNVLIAQTIAEYRQTAYMLKDPTSSMPSILASLDAALNNPEKKPSFLDRINITEMSLGEEFPIFSNCRIIAVEDANSDGGRLQALMDVDMSDENLTLALETSLILNYPKPFSAVLPVALAVSVVRFSGTLSISLVPASTPPTEDQAQPATPPQSPQPSNGDASKPAPSTSSAAPNQALPKTNLAFSFLPDYRLELSVQSLVGSRSRLQDVPKIAQLVEARVHSWFEERVVEPRVQVVALPGLWPRMKRTGVRGGDGADGAAAAEGAQPPPVGSIGSGTTTFPNLAGTSTATAPMSPRAGLRMRGRGASNVFDDEDSDEYGIDDDGPHMRMPGSMPGVVV